MAKKQEDALEALAEEQSSDVMEPVADEEAGGLAEKQEESVIPQEAAEESAGESPPPKKRRTRKKAVETEEPETSEPLGVPGEVLEENPPEPHQAEEAMQPEAEEAEAPEAVPEQSTPRRGRQTPVLTLEAGAEVETEESLADLAWHEIHNAYRTRRILTGQLGGLEQTDNGKTLAIVEYKGFRIVIPLKEMVLDFPNHLNGKEYSDMIVRQHKLLSRMLGAEIDFVVRGIDSKTRSVVASRREAMLKKRQTFYLDTNEAGEYRIYEGRIVQARVIAAAEKAIRIEAFGVECSIMARDLAWEWIGDARERFSVGDQILVRIRSVNREDLEHIAITADVRSVSGNRQNNLNLCRVQSKYAGRVTDVHKGVVYVRLTNGVNAVAHSCYDRRMPGKKDDVSFVVTGMDEERGIALGIITRIIRQNL